MVAQHWDGYLERVSLPRPAGTRTRRPLNWIVSQQGQQHDRNNPLAKSGTGTDLYVEQHWHYCSRMGRLLSMTIKAGDEWWPIGTIIHPPVGCRLLQPVRLMEHLALAGEPWPIARPPARPESPTLQPIRDLGIPALQIPMECSKMGQAGFCINAVRPIRGRFTIRPTLTRTRYKAERNLRLLQLQLQLQLLRRLPQQHRHQLPPQRQLLPLRSHQHQPRLLHQRRRRRRRQVEG